MFDYFEGKALDRVLDRRERGESGRPVRRSETGSLLVIGALVLMIFALFVNALSKLEAQVKKTGVCTQTIQCSP